MSAQNDKSEQQSQQSTDEKKKGGFLSFLAISQSSYINQVFNNALWKCFDFYHEEFRRQYKAKTPNIEIKDFFGNDQPMQTNDLGEFEKHCVLKMKEYTDSHLFEEQKVFSNCRKDCEAANSSAGKVMSFIKNEGCYKNCRIDFDKQNKEKIVEVFSRFLPELLELQKTNRRNEQSKQEKQKIKEFKSEYGGTDK